MKVSKIYEGKVILTTIYLINRMSSQVLAFKSSIYTILESFPDFQGIVSLPPKIYGCYSFVHVHNHNLRSKHDPKALKCIFLGYSHTQKGYKSYHPPNKRKYITMDVTFIGNKPYFFETCLQGESNKIVEDRWQDSSKVLKQDFDSAQVVEHDCGHCLDHVLLVLHLIIRLIFMIVLLLILLLLRVNQSKNINFKACPLKLNRVQVPQVLTRAQIPQKLHCRFSHLRLSTRDLKHLISMSIPGGKDP